jgi:DNA-binding NarL/FixJ family response regulator
LIRVLIADDDPLVREGLRAIAELEGDIKVVGEAADGKQAVESSRELVLDVILMDIRMPAMDGIEATRRILASAPAPRIIMLTTFDRNEYVYESLKAGASGFLLKDVRRGQLVQAIREVMKGDALLAPSITRRLVEEYCYAPSGQLGSPEGTGRSDCPRGRGARTGRSRVYERGNRRVPFSRRNHGQDPCR